MGDILKDPRFAHAVKDSRFRNVPKKEKKVKIDKRFQSMFTDERFQFKSVVDKRGRPVVSKGTEHLERFYNLSDDEGEERDPEQGDNVLETTKTSRETLHPKIKAKLNDLKIDYARGEGRILTDSSSDEESSSEEEDEEIDHGWGEFDKDAPTIEDETYRLAVCNMDWDRITAQDLMVLFNSFLPPGGVIQSVRIYPSEFGLKRMEEEEREGPEELTEMSTAGDKEDESLTEGQREKLRQYQLKRLKYFYAVLDFDSPRTAYHVYKECDGLEYESSMNRLDLRFIPDDTDFDQKPREECKELPDLTTYKPRHFRTTALTQVKVDLTWDETDPIRQEMIRAAHEGKVDDNRLENFLASSSSEEEEDEKELDDFEVIKEGSEKSTIEKYKSLLADLEKKEESKKDDVALEVTWDLQLEQKTAEKIKKATEAKDDKTPFEKFIGKKKEKRKMKKNSKKLKEETEGAVDAFSDDEIPSDIDLNDPYFKEELDKMKGSKKATKKKNKIVKEDSEEEQKQAELELLMMDEAAEEQKQHFSLKKIEASEKKPKKKRKLLKKIKNNAPKDGDNFKIDVNDERFSAMFTSHLYNVDPAEPNFRPTESMKAIIDEKLRRRSSAEPNAKVPKLTEEKKKSAELNLLVKSIKRKTQETKKKKIIT